MADDDLPTIPFVEHELILDSTEAAAMQQQANIVNGIMFTVLASLPEPTLTLSHERAAYMARTHYLTTDTLNNGTVRYMLVARDDT